MRMRLSRRRSHRLARPGFTIVELLIVIIVIAIIASIVIAVFNGTVQRAQATGAASAAAQASRLLANSATINGSYPSDLSTVNNGGPLVSSGGTTYLYHPAPDGSSYCLTVRNGSSSYMATDSTQGAQAGSCPGDGGSGGGGTTITNLALNPSMESDINGYLDKGDNPVTMTSTTSAAWSGSTSLQASWAASSTGKAIIESDKYPVTTGSTYTASAYMRQTAGLSRSCWLNINWFTSSKSYISESVGPTQPSQLGSWVRYSTTATAPANAAYMTIQFRFGSTNAGDTFLVDGVMSTLGSTLYTYADGNSPGWSWSGTTNDSASTGPSL